MQFAEGIGRSLRLAWRGRLKPGAPLAFTYHHNKLEAYHSIGVAILDAGLTCSASLPCPAEMGGSIHIHGTGSSIIDTVFVCRANGEANRRHIFSSMGELTRIVRDELGQLRLRRREADGRGYSLHHSSGISPAWRSGYAAANMWTPQPPRSEKLARL